MDLHKILVCFNAPLTEEQAWAICYQCGTYLKEANEESGFSYSCPQGLKSIIFDEEGCVVINGKLLNGELEVLKNLGLILFSALDYSLAADEEQLISDDLDHVISCMTGQLLCSETDSDEGYDDKKTADEEATLDSVIMLCERRLLHSVKFTSSHYQDVCRAMVKEALELNFFLRKMAAANVSLDNLSNSESACYVADGCYMLADCTVSCSTEWAPLWMQVMEELRCGATQLRKMDKHMTDAANYQLTPYEMMLKDIRQGNYTLKKVSPSDLAASQVKKSSHDVILDIIRSKPTLSPASKRVLRPAPPRSMSLHESLIEQIQQQAVSLRHVDIKPAKPFYCRSSSSGTHIVSSSQIGRKLAKWNCMGYDVDPNDVPSTESYSGDVTSEYGSSSLSSDNSRNSTESTGTSGVSSAYGDDVDDIIHRSFSINFSESIRRKRLLPLEMLQSPDQSALKSRSSFIATLFSSFRSPSGLQRSKSVAMRSASSNCSMKKLSDLEEDVTPSIKRSPPSHFVRTFSERKTHLSKSMHPVSSKSMTSVEVMYVRESRDDMEKFVSSKQLQSTQKICWSCRNRKFGLFVWQCACQICKKKVCGKCLRKIERPTNQVITLFSSLTSVQYDTPLTRSTTFSHHFSHHDRLSGPIASQLWSRGKMEVCIGCYECLVGVTAS